MEDEAPGASREDTKRGYQRSLKYHLLPVFGDRLLSAITAADIQDFIAAAVSSRGLAPKTVNNALALLTPSQILGYLNPRRFVESFMYPTLKG